MLALLSLLPSKHSWNDVSPFNTHVDINEDRMARFS